MINKMKKKTKSIRNTCRHIHKNKLETIICKQTPAWLKNVQTKQQETKISPNITFVFILCFPCTDGHGACEVWFVHLVCLLWRTIFFSFARGCELEIASWLGMEASVYVPIWALGPWLGPVLALCVLQLSLCVHMWISPVVSGWHSSCGVIHPPMNITVFPYLLRHSPLSFKGRNLMKTSTED